MSRLADTDAAAAYLHVSPSFLNKKRCFGGGPPFLKLGTRVIYDLDAMDVWINEHRRLFTDGKKIGIPRKKKSPSPLVGASLSNVTEAA